MRPDTQQNQDARDKSKDDERVKIVRPLVEGLQFSNFEKFKEANYRRGANSRLCGNITQIDVHINYAETENNHCNFCKVYGEVSYSKCSICGVYIIFFHF